MKRPKIERLTQESPRAFAALKAYCEMGVNRSIAKVSQKVAKAIPVLKRWSAKYHWTDRARAFDDCLEHLRQEAADRELKKSAARWAKRQFEHREQTWQRIQRALQAVDATLKKPMAKTTLGDIARALQTLDNIQRLCLGLPTGKTEISGPDNKPVVPQQYPVVIYLPDDGRGLPDDGGTPTDGARI